MQLTPPPELTGPVTRRIDAASVALIVLALLAPFALYFATARSIVDIWNSSETFAHGYIILPISLWLIWRRRANFVSMPPAPWWPAFGLLALVGAGWLLARLADVQVVQQYAFAAMFPAIALALFGRRLATSLAFPLLFVLAAVPFGEIFVGSLISFTADFTVKALQLTGIPVLRNGTMFEIPSGSWSVVEACSGVRYLISSVTLGMLYAYLTYHSWRRRALFMVAAVVVPIIANGLRAYMIVMIGHLSSMTLATGVDHLVYGWAFFGLVMFTTFWIGSYWRENERPAPANPGGVAGAGAGRARIAAAAAAALALSALWPVLAMVSERISFNPRPVVLDQIAAAWTPAAAFSGWTPNYMAPDAASAGVFAPPAGSAVAPVALRVLYYRNQNPAKSLISSINTLTAYRDSYHQSGSALRREPVGGRTLELREGRLHGPEGNVLVWHWLWIDGRTTSNPYLGKLWQLQARLLMRGDDGAAVLLSAPYAEKPEQARAAMRAFLAANSGAIDAALATTRQR